MASHSRSLAKRIHGQRLAGCSPKVCTESDTTEETKQHQCFNDSVAAGKAHQLTKKHLFKSLQSVILPSDDV